MTNLDRKMLPVAKELVLIAKNVVPIAEEVVPIAKKISLIAKVLKSFAGNKEPDPDPGEQDLNLDEAVHFV